VRVARSRALVAAGYQPAVVARVAGISRQALYRRPGRRPPAAGPGADSPDDQVIVEVAKANPTDGTRMVAALASRQLGRPVNRKRVQRVMRAHRLLQPSRSGDRWRRPGFFRITRPDELWHLDMTKVWTAQHGWVYLHAIIDCCTRELVGWSLGLRCRDDEAIACVEEPCSPATWVRERSPSAPTLVASSPPGISAGTCQPAGSPTGAVATAIPSPRRRRLPASAPFKAGLPHPAEVAATWRPDPDMLQTPAT
jgi:hypothetical protein